jgi:hypothetical protein
MLDTTDAPFRMVEVDEAPLRGRGCGGGPGASFTGARSTHITATDRVIEALCLGMYADNVEVVFEGLRTGTRVTLAVAPAPVGAPPAADGRVLKCVPRHGEFDPLFVQGGQALSVRFCGDGGLYALQTQVVLGNPTSLLCTWPTAIDVRCRRVSPRIGFSRNGFPRVHLPVAPGGATETVPVRDLSVGGMRLELPPELLFPLGRSVHMALALGADVPLVPLVGVARNITSDDAAGSMLYGVELLAPPMSAEQAIERFLRQTTHH